MCLAVDLEDSNFFAICLTLLAGNLSRSIFESFIVQDTKSSSFRKKQNMSLCRIFAVSCGYPANLIWFWTALCHLPTEQSPCLKLVSRSNLALTSFVWSLQISSNFFQITSKLKSSRGRSHETYWSIPKSPDHAINFLHFLDSDSTASSQWSMFSHLIFHFRNLLYKPSSTFQFILGPSI